MSIVTVNRNTIAANAKPGAEIAPPIRIARSPSAGATAYGSEVAILDKNGEEVARFVYDAHNALAKCGARLILNTKFEPQVIR